MMPAVSCTEAVTSGSYAKYPEAVSLISQAADHLDITGKTVLVIGSEAPWVETILLMRKPRCHLISGGFMIMILVISGLVLLSNIGKHKGAVLFFLLH